jgi:hypothetical protein
MTTAAEQRVASSGTQQQTVSVKRWPQILRRSAKQFKRHDLSDRAAALTYFGVLAIFPGMLVLVSIFGLLGHSTTQSFLDNLQEIAPSGVNSFVRTVISQVQGRATAASIAAIVGIVIALVGFWICCCLHEGIERDLRCHRGATDYPHSPGSRRRDCHDDDHARHQCFDHRGYRAGRPPRRRRARNRRCRRSGLEHRQMASAARCGLAHVLLALLGVSQRQAERPTGDYSWCCDRDRAVACLLGPVALYVPSRLVQKTYGSLARVIFLVWLWISNIALIWVRFDAEQRRER